MFGEAFTDHMVVMRWADGEWGALELQPFAPLSLSPATLALHYGQSIFEALKAYALADGSVGLFRPDRNAARMAMSAERIAMPALPDGVFEQACQLLVDIDRAWVPTADGAALYVRPFMFGSEPHLSVRPANEYLFVVIASPVASYFGPELRAITVAVETSDVRATPGGTGAAKFAGNYAAGFAAHGQRGCRGPRPGALARRGRAPLGRGAQRHERRVRLGPRRPHRGEHPAVDRHHPRGRHTRLAAGGHRRRGRRRGLGGRRAGGRADLDRAPARRGAARHAARGVRLRHRGGHRAHRPVRARRRRTGHR